MELQYKGFHVHEFKVLDPEQGIVEAIVAVFSKPDYEQDVIEPGFFDDTIKSGKLPKGIWMHDMHQPIIKTLDARELMPGDPMLPAELKEYGGLYVKGQCNLNTQRGREAFEDLKFGTVDEFSFGYIATQKKYIEGKRHLYKGFWYEWSLVTLGMHPDTVLMSVKAADLEGQADGGDMKKIDVKGMFEEELSDRMLTLWNLYDVLSCVLYKIDQQEDASDALGIPYDYEGTLRAALEEFSARVLQGRLEEEAEEEAAAAGGVADAAGVIAASGAKSRRLGDGRGFEAYLNAVGDAVEGAVGRTKSRHEMRTKEGRVLSTKNESALADISKRARAMADEIDALLESNAKQPGGKAWNDADLEIKAKVAYASLRASGILPN
jgi:HK97 family phage prohead protease